MSYPTLRENTELFMEEFVAALDDEGVELDPHAYTYGRTAAVKAACDEYRISKEECAEFRVNHEAMRHKAQDAARSYSAWLESGGMK